MLLNAAPVTNTAGGVQAEAQVAQAGDFMAAMLATMPVPGAASPAGVLPQPEASSADGDSPEDPAAVELAAAIAAMLVAVAPVGSATADAGSSASDGNSTDGAALQPLDGESAAAPDAALNRLLQALSQRLAKSTTDAADSGAMPAVDPAPAPAPLLPPRMVDTAAAALVAAARQPELLPPAETQAQPSAQSLASSLASSLAATMGPTPHSQAPASAASAAASTLHAAVGTPRWSEELGTRMVLMSLHGQHEGSLNLTPEHLGPLEVRLSVHQGTASVWFGSQHADTRAALTEALPRLRELFADAGLQLGHTGVSHEAPRQGTRESEAARFGGGSGADAIEGAATVAPVTQRMALGLVDTYA
jgi:flagellar hook-length control protein FliK